MAFGMEASQLVVLAVGVIACWFDLRTRHIPNFVTFGAAAAGLCAAFLLHGPWGLALSLGGWLTGFALFIPFFLLGGMGAGDVKLLAGLGAWLGPQITVWVALYSMIAGGVMAVGLALATGYLQQAILNVWLLILHWRQVGLKPLPELTLTAGRGPRLPYALPIAAGAAAAIWLKP